MRQLRRGEVGEPLLERDRQQESGEDLRAGLRDPQLLQQLVPVAVEALALGLVAPVAGHGVPVSASVMPRA